MSYVAVCLDHASFQMLGT